MGAKEEKGVGEKVVGMKVGEREGEMEETLKAPVMRMIENKIRPSKEAKKWRI